MVTFAQTYNTFYHSKLSDITKGTAFSIHTDNDGEDDLMLNADEAESDALFSG